MKIQLSAALVAAIGATLAFSAGLHAAAPAKSLLLDFDHDEPGSLPKTLRIAETAGQGTPATWAVVADDASPSAPHAFGTTRNKNYGYTFNLALVSGSSFKDVDISVKVRSISGKEDQGGGPLWRALDENNYYLCRYNPLEHNFRVYRVKNGRRKQLASAQVELDAGTWHTIRAVMQGSKIECFLDGKKLLTVQDRTFMATGQVGLWVKADGITIFDDLRAGPAGAR